MISTRVTHRDVCDVYLSWGIGQDGRVIRVKTRYEGARSMPNADGEESVEGCRQWDARERGTTSPVHRETVTYLTRHIPLRSRHRARGCPQQPRAGVAERCSVLRRTRVVVIRSTGSSSKADC